MRVGGYQGPKSVLTAGLSRFCESLAAEGLDTERVDDVTQSGETARALFDGIESGAFQAGYMASGYLTARVPELAVIDLPFSQGDRHAAYAALDGRAGAILREAVHGATGYHVLGFWDNGFRHLTNHRRPLRSRADCNGLVVRTLDNRIYRETMAAMGFTPVVTDVRDLREAVMTGRVDAQENPLTNSVVFELYRDHRHLSMTGHFFGVVLFLCHADWFGDLPPAARRAVEAAAATATVRQRRLAEAQDSDALTILQAEGVEILPRSALDMAGFRAACAAIMDRERAKLPPELVAAYLGQ
ncbi:MAG: TRAP transporter substrate-binding protein [Paracoccus sp. (in: a-proteobacteria)]|uniref:TRAP transporter substrate-binding protein n=2 Tax=Paracoccus sp. TaxID=267 RepID=UPI0026D2FA5E|tara:strand:- start:553 stop:1452 length:900 start_codon:yes stop_codon:yes gene_type:complete